MTSKKITAIFLLILLIPAYGIYAQTGTTQATAAFDSTGFPQWAKDLRRWEIIAFGSFPFTMLLSTTIMDMIRWNNANGMNFSDAGRRYAPWPLKSAGAVAMSDRQMRTTIQIAVGLSAAVAFADLIIVKARQNRERRRAEALPVGTTIITRTPLPEEPTEEEEVAQPDEDNSPP